MLNRLPPSVALALAFIVSGAACSSDPSSGASDVVDDLDATDAANDGPSGVECPEEGVRSVRDTGLGLWTGCPETWAELLPRALVDGEWRGAGADGPCSADDQAVTCPAGPAGTVTAAFEAADTVVVRFDAAQGVGVEALELTGRAHAEGATGWISSGFQSWSQSGVVAIGDPPSDRALENALEARGNAEVIRSGTELSWFYTAVGGGPTGIMAGALSADLFRPWVQVSRASDGGLSLRLVSGASGESVALESGQSTSGSPWLLELGAEPNAMLADYAERLPAGPSAPADVGWNSWYELWAGVDDPAVRANAPIAAGILEPLLDGAPDALRIVVDDGWQEQWGEWTPNEKFPEGLDGLVTALEADGYSVGVWLAPFLVDQDSALVADHPDWFVGDAVYHHAVNGPMRVLDVTHPDVEAHLRDTIARIVGWGFDFLKIDFLFAGSWEGQRRDEVTGMEAFHRGMQIIRDAAGDDVLLLAVAAPPVAVFPYVEAWRVGWDIALETFGPSWPFVQSQARSLAVRWPLCSAVLCDADPVLLRALPRDEVEVGGWVVALSGGGLFLSDDLRQLPEERRSWGLDARRAALATGGVPSRPADLFPEQPPRRLSNAFGDHLTGNATHVVPALWELSDGGRVAINFGDEAIEVEGVTVDPRTAVALDE